MKEIYDIRNQMPKFEANFFPQYKYQPYPRMMINKETGKPFRELNGKPVIVQDEHEEKLFLAKHYKPEPDEAPKAVEIPVALADLVQDEKSEVPTKRKYTRRLPT